jgi:hypothetical protein
MLSEFLKKNIKSQAAYILKHGYGYGQVEPNHLSGQATKEVYAQLPAKKDIEVLENGQFVKYDYLNEVVDFDGKGEWMLVWNEIKLYRDHQIDAEFAMIRDNYQARVYSPFGGDREGNPDTVWEKQSRYYNGQGVDAKDGSITFDNEAGTVSFGDKTFPIDDVTAGPDMYEIHYNEDPFHIESLYKEKLMPENGSSMVPRVMKTHVGDIFTTNMIGDEDVELGDELSPRAEDGILSKSGDGSMLWQVVKVYTMPDHQPGVKLMRIK